MRVRRRQLKTERPSDAMCRFWLDLSEDELLQIVARIVPESLREKARALAVTHYEQAFQSATYLKHTRKQKERKSA
jgi:hypothetical protein